MVCFLWHFFLRSFPAVCFDANKCRRPGIDQTFAQRPTTMRFKMGRMVLPKVKQHKAGIHVRAMPVTLPLA